jgi:hypothetical protein
MKTIAVALAAGLLVLSGCANMSNTEQRILSGGVIGAATGAAVGAVTGGLGVGAGAAIGAAVGAAGGYVYDKVKE